MAEVVRHPSSSSEREPFVDAQVIADLGQKKSTVQAWASRRKIPCYEFPPGAKRPNVRFLLSEIEAWVRDGERRARRRSR